MIYVLDAAAAVDLIIRSDQGERVREVLSADDAPVLVTVGHMDAEVFSALSRLCRAAMLTSEEVGNQLRRLATLPVQRIPITGQLVKAAWSFRDNIAARDALYVAAAETLQARLLTTDDRLARAIPSLIASAG